MVLTLHKPINDAKDNKYICMLDQEVKSGELNMIQKINDKTGTICVFVVVYKTEYDHFVVIHRTKIISHDGIYINMKHYKVLRENTNRICLVPCENTEGTKVTFEMRNTQDLSEWIKAFQITQISKQIGSTSHKRGIKRVPSMGTVQEEREE